MFGRRHAAGAIVFAGVLAVALCISSAQDGMSAAASRSSTSSGQAKYAAALKTEIPQIMKANAIPGVVVLIRSRHQGDWSAAFGTKKIGTNEPMSLGDYIRIASNTKTMTATVILQLVQAGKLSLDDPISKYVGGIPNGDQVTIGQLAEMRSGLDSFTSNLEYEKLLDTDPTKAYTPDELLAIARAQTPLSPPDQTFYYSNTNYLLLGLVIQKVTGKSAAANFEQRIFKPLGLQHTSFPAQNNSSIPEPHAQGYQFGTNVEDIDSYALPPAEVPGALNGTLLPINYTKSNPSAFWTAGAVISTPADMATYVKAMVSGELLDKQTQSVRIASVLPINPANPTVGYGYGLIEFRPFLYGHDGQTPGFSTVIAYDVKDDITIFIGTNLSASPVNGANAATIVLKAVEAVLYPTS